MSKTIACIRGMAQTNRALESGRSIARASRKWSRKVGEISGIAISVDATFLLLVAWFAMAFWFEVGNLARDPKQSLWIALAGPAVNVAIAAALFATLRVTGAWRPIAGISLNTGLFLERLMFVNISLVLFNMLPAFPMDGGRALRALLATRLDERRATRIAARLGQGMAALFAIVGWLANPLLILIALFVWTGATQEAAMADLRVAFRGVPVARVMLTAFRSLTPRGAAIDCDRASKAGANTTSQ